MDSLEAKVDALLESNQKILAAIERLEPGVTNMDDHIRWVESVIQAAYSKPLWAVTQATNFIKKQQ